MSHNARKSSVEKGVTQYGDGAMGGKEVLANFDPRDWTLLWEGRRPSDRDERFRLLRRAR
jgi:hypothetical protein